MVVSSWPKALAIITGCHVLSDLAHQKMKECSYSSNHILLPKASQYCVRHLGKLLNVTGHPEFIFGDKLHGYLASCFSFFISLFSLIKTLSILK